jgi:NAD(P)-dependent dehydrogenase (short-subunit alcohol dehydrogenase family)
MVRELATRGARVALINRSAGKIDRLAETITQAGGEALSIPANVLDRKALEAAEATIVGRWGRVDALLNGAGGNVKEATIAPDGSFFDMPEAALRDVIDLNLLGTVLPSQVFARGMAAHKSGSIVNISSMNSFRPLTRIVGYSAAKASVNNFTQWLAVHMAQRYSADIRVNALVPGFFETRQNRFLLRDEATGELSARGRQILEHTPLGRFGTPEDLTGALIWLLSPSARFVTGILVPIDGGFSAYSGV